MPDAPETPLADAVDAFLRLAPATFSTPGHKRARWLVGDDPFLLSDAPLVGGADDLRSSLRYLDRAQELAARAFGADRCWFSVNGSTHANQALCMAVAGPGDRAIVARTSHRSIFAGMVLAGFDPVWVTPDVDPESGFALSIGEQRLRDAFAREPATRAALLVEPSWLGLLSDVAAAARVCAEHGAALVCDQAWGAHFGFHPDLPASALALGADGISISAHKTLSSFTQGALLLARAGGVLDLGRLAQAFDTLFTTSPSGTLMASLDRTRALLESEGERLLGDALRLAAQARERLAAIPGVRLLDASLIAQESVHAVDPLKLALDLSATGADGIDVDRDLRAAGVYLEGADRTVLVPLLCIGNDEHDVDRLVEALALSLARRRGTAARPTAASSAWAITPDQAMSPREAFFAPHERIPATRAAGRVAAEVAAPYPPGIPVLAPGERITADLLGELRSEAAAGHRIAGASDPTLETVIVVA